jgi:CheY-like chemotaxis protein
MALEGSPSILVVEDEVVILHLMEDALEEGGFKVVLAPSGERAVQALDAQTAPFRAGD